MSWQATAWAVKQRTGSPTRKALLLVLASYADKGGVCWPAQKILADYVEASTDTIQRHLKVLERKGLLKITRRKRQGGRWPSLEYELNMPSGHTEPQNAARADKSLPVDNGRVLRPGRAATGPVTVPHNVRHEHSKNPSYEPLAAPIVWTAAQGTKAADERSQRTESVQHRIAARLGQGNIAAGWEMLGSLSAATLAEITSEERAGALDEAKLAGIRLAYTVARKVGG
jgi:SOS-response transcriptional repressor LexA